MKPIFTLTTILALGTNGLIGSTLENGSSLFATQSLDPSVYGVIGATFLGIMVLVRRRELRKS